MKRTDSESKAKQKRVGKRSRCPVEVAQMRQDAVLQAVTIGYTNSKDISRASNVPYKKVHFFLTRLIDAGLVVSVRSAGRFRQYQLKSLEPNLWNIWKGRAIIRDDDVETEYIEHSESPAN